MGIPKPKCSLDSVMKHLLPGPRMVSRPLSLKIFPIVNVAGGVRNPCRIEFGPERAESGGMARYHYEDHPDDKQR
jgi:hypothetical protein